MREWSDPHVSEIATSFDDVMRLLQAADAVKIWSTVATAGGRCGAYAGLFDIDKHAAIQSFRRNDYLFDPFMRRPAVDLTIKLLPAVELKIFPQSCIGNIAYVGNEYIAELARFALTERARDAAEAQS